MIRSVAVTNYRNESILLELGAPANSGFLVQEITGLGPSKANINMSELSTTDGSRYNSARSTYRNIVMTLIFMHNPDIETMRQLSYRYFPIKKRIKLEFELDNRTCEIYGYVESNEPIMFSNQSNTVISIICPDPYFLSSGDGGLTTTLFYGIEATFEFPFSNESTSEPLMEMGTIATSYIKNIAYTGDEEIGMTIYIHAIGSATDFTMLNIDTNEVFAIDTDRLQTLTGDVIINGDDITICTIKGQKTITLMRDGVSINILNCVDRDADWFQLTKGDNPFEFYAATGIDKLQIRIENNTIYEGV
jgi:hypothetical protein